MNRKDDLPGRIKRALEEDAEFDGVGEAEKNTDAREQAREAVRQMWNTAFGHDPF